MRVPKNLQPVTCAALIVVVCFCAQTTATKDEADDEVLTRVRRVIGGKSATEGEWPWLVSLQGKFVTRKLFGFIPIAWERIYCGGSVLNDRWILTAAHCFKDSSFPDAMKTSSWHVRLAAVDLHTGFFSRIRHFFGKIFGLTDWQQWNKHINHIIIHPGYNPDNKWENDIALAYLKETVPSGWTVPNIRRVDLAASTDNSFPVEGNSCVVTGWGCKTNGGGVSSTAMSTDLSVKDPSTCGKLYRIGDMSTRLCAGTTGRGICKGDSGGPLVCRRDGRWVQTGVASLVHADRPDLNPSVFTRVSQYADWIRRYVGNNG